LKASDVEIISQIGAEIYNTDVCRKQEEHAETYTVPYIQTIGNNEIK